MKQKNTFFLWLGLLLASPNQPVNTSKNKINNPLKKELIQEKNFEEELEENQAIGLASGSLNKDFDTASDVITLGGMTKPTTHLCTKCGVEISFTGRARIEGMSGTNTKYFNTANLTLDNYLVPGKSTFDLGISASSGKQSIYQKEVISLAADLRSRSTWGQPERVASTTVTTINENGVTYGAHNHSIGVPVLYVRGLDLTLDLNSIFCSLHSDEYQTQKLKLGFFPVEIGRGIVLGAAYAVTPDVLSYAPSDVIQEFAPGFMLFGSFNKDKTLDYRLYLSILKNNSSSHSDLLLPIRANQYGQKSFPYRGSNVFNIVSACQIDWKCILDNDNKVVFSPYVMIGYEGAGKITFPEDSKSTLVTYGFEFAAEQSNWIIDFEFAKNNGSQYVFGLDTNTLKKEQRTCDIDGNSNSSSNVIVNDKVIFKGYKNTDPASSFTTDIIDKPTTFLGKDSVRQKAINAVPMSSFENGREIILPSNTKYTMINAPDRFRDPYQNFFTGCMAVFDIARTINICETPCKWAFALGYASGGDNPNSSLEKKNDHIENGDYSGFIGIQEIYSGKMVRSAFLMQGAGKMPRIGSIPAVILNETGQITETIEFPSPISGFNNLLYAGTSLNFIHQSSNEAYHWKWHPNILCYWQPDARNIYNQKVINILGKDTLNPFLGTECNLFLEVISKQLEGLKFFFVATMFIPGGYYNDLSKIPLDKSQENALYNKQNIFTPLLSTNNAYYLNIGIEFKF